MANSNSVVLLIGFISWVERSDEFQKGRNSQLRLPGFIKNQSSYSTLGRTSIVALTLLRIKITQLTCFPLLQICMINGVTVATSPVSSSGGILLVWYLRLRLQCV